MERLAIHSKRVVAPGGLRDAFVLIESGHIIDILDDLQSGSAEEIIDIGEQVLMPGVIDPHVHINEPGRTEWEGFETATRAAISGGITTLVDMPLNASPVTTTVAAFEEKLSEATGKLHTDCGFWGGIIPLNTGEIAGLINKGVLGFKAFLTHSGIDEFPNATEDDLRKAMPIIAKYGLPLLVHCELTDDAVVPGDSRSYQRYLASRPRYWEDDAIALMIRLCEEFNCRTHIVHLSSANSIPQIVAAKQKGLPLTVETGQHYLYFNAENIPDGATAFKCAPPIRERENNLQLLEALKAGIIDFAATDHSPAPADMKQLGSGDFTKAWGGISSIQFALPILWTVAKSNGAGTEDIARWLCENPAKLIGKEKSLGKIAAGFEANLVAWNPEASFTVSEDIIHHRHKTTPYLGETLFGVVSQTFLKGSRVYNNGSFEHTGSGKIILA